jgi:hypothetical protein
MQRAMIMAAFAWFRLRTEVGPQVPDHHLLELGNQEHLVWRAGRGDGGDRTGRSPESERRRFMGWLRATTTTTAHVLPR